MINEWKLNTQSSCYMHSDETEPLILCYRGRTRGGCTAKKKKKEKYKKCYWNQFLNKHYRRIVRVGEKLRMKDIKTHNNQFHLLFFQCMYFANLWKTKDKRKLIICPVNRSIPLLHFLLSHIQIPASYGYKCKSIFVNYCVIPSCLPSDMAWGSICIPHVTASSSSSFIFSKYLWTA